MKRKAKKPGAQAGLSVEICKDELIIRIGIRCLADGYQQSPHGQPYDERRNEFLQAKVTAPALFAKEVLLALEDEEEDGSTPVTRLLDQACKRAVEDGAEGVEYPAMEVDRGE